MILPRVSGIYQIKNLINNKIYIGSAVDIQSRARIHLHELRHKKHGNQYLQKSYDKYGEDAFKFEVLFTCTKEDLIRLEQYHINNYHPEYNICRIAGSTLGRRMSEEAKQKMRRRVVSEERKQQISEFFTGKVYSKEEREIRYSSLSRPIYQVDKNSREIINLFPSISEASRVLSIDYTSISRCLSGRFKSGGGFIWKYKNKMIDGTEQI